MKLKDRMKKTKANHITMVAELKDICDKRRFDTTRAGLFEPVKAVDVIAAVRERVEVLAEWEHYQKLGDDLKAKNRSIYEPIPHVDDFLTDVLCEIKVKDAYRTLSKRNYQSPQKYKDTWQTLIQTHLDAGRIRPSNSPHASPAFLIPKADKTALPRWVNDFCELN
jgi:hypothetical protein